MSAFSTLKSTILGIQTWGTLLYFKYTSTDAHGFGALLVTLLALSMLSRLWPAFNTVFGRIFHVYDISYLNIGSSLRCSPTDVLSQADAERDVTIGMKEIIMLENVEKQLARQYGMTGDIDSVDVFQETKARALSQRDAHSVNALEKLHKLYYFRLKPAFTQLQRISQSEVSTFSTFGASQLVDGSRFWAVLIGIDAYTSLPLRGCVSDVLAMENYLIRDLHVPRNRIQRLLGSTKDRSPDDSAIPSRANIVNTLCSLIDNPHIRGGDNIIIYYSGHGSNYDFPDSDDNMLSEMSVAGTGSIEALCPIDRDHPDENGIPIPDISDREFNVILNEISRAKGHRITVILDCCHSGSFTRCPMEPGVRTMPPLPRASLQDMLHAADENMKGFPSYLSVSADEWHPNMASHVVLAACKDYQFAKETQIKGQFHGFFTQSLLQTLRSSILAETSTYLDLIQVLPWSMYQTPVVAGKHKSARLWYKNT